MKRILKKTLFLLLTFFVWTSCGVPDQEQIRPETGSIAIRLQSPQTTERTLTPVLDTVISTYDISGTGPEAHLFEANDIADTMYTTTGLEPGSWTITVNAKNASGTVLGTGSTAVTVTRGQMTAATITMGPATGDGTLELFVSWPESTLVNPVLAVTLTDLEGTTITPAVAPTVTIIGEQASYSAALPAGFYAASISLNDDVLSVWSKIEAIRISPNEATDGTWNLAAQDMHSLP